MYSLSSLDVLLMKTVRLTIIYGSQIDVMLDIHCFEWFLKEWYDLSIF